MEVATVMAIALAHGGVSPYDLSVFLKKKKKKIIFYSKVSNMTIKPSDLKQ